MKITILGEAQDDLIQGFRFYESRLRMKIVLKSGGNSIDPGFRS